MGSDLDSKIRIDYFTKYLENVVQSSVVCLLTKFFPYIEISSDRLLPRFPRNIVVLAGLQPVTALSPRSVNDGSHHAIRSSYN